MNNICSQQESTHRGNQEHGEGGQEGEGQEQCQGQGIVYYFNSVIISFWVVNLSSRKPEHITGGSGPSARRSGEAKSGRTVADRTVRLEDKRFFYT